ncbi:MAG: agmatinase [Ignavibacteria bacterium]|jgi:agmatinase|nr:agmatinase [Ignavibacteria bacterium]
MQTLSEDKNFLAIEEQFSNYEDSKIVILQVPYEHTVSYGGGTKLAPQAILDASAFVEFYDDEFNSELCFEQKIATLPPVDLTDCYDDEMLRKVRYFIDKLLADNKFVVTLGGEHTISTAPIAAHFSKYKNMSVLHFDAHSDLRDEYQSSKYSHACFMARVSEFFPTEQITQVGIRAQCREEAEFIKRNNINTFYASAIRRGLHSQNWQKQIVNTLGSEVYITFDVDYFDPAIMPTTGTPEPDGFLYNETLNIFREIKASGRKIIGFDVVELAPVQNIHHTDILVARLIYKLMNFAF